MTPLRFFRIGGLAGGVIFLFTLSQEITLAREGETAPGLAVGLGVISLLFLVRALVTEHARGAEASLEKDVLWGLGLGALGAALSLLL